MSYPMTYRRFLLRNGLDDAGALPGGLRAWLPQRLWQKYARRDLRRLEQDQRDPQHLAEYARIAGIRPEQAKAILDAFIQGLNSRSQKSPK